MDSARQCSIIDGNVHSNFVAPQHCFAPHNPYGLCHGCFYNAMMMRFRIDLARDRAFRLAAQSTAMMTVPHGQFAMQMMPGPLVSNAAAGIGPMPGPVNLFRTPQLPVRVQVQPGRGWMPGNLGHSNTSSPANRLFIVDTSKMITSTQSSLLQNRNAVGVHEPATPPMVDAPRRGQGRSEARRAKRARQRTASRTATAQAPVNDQPNRNEGARDVVIRKHTTYR